MNTLFISLCCCIVFTSWSQQETSRAEQAIQIDYYQRLWVDFEIKDNPNPDPELVRHIPFLEYDELRDPLVDKEIPDPTSGYVIILYSHERCRSNKQ
jgi:hypothetical protein